MSDYRNQWVAVGTSSVLVSNAGFRRELIITNASTAGQNITLSIGIPATTKMGIYLAPLSTYFASSQQDFRVTSQEIYAIGDAASGVLSVYERR